eukprot:7141720-Alexandrium_andersonii.AAC.1
MSASLVGSEMCIRDSHTQCAHASPHLVKLAFMNLDCQPREQGGMDLGAVSYTHLTLPTICSV